MATDTDVLRVPGTEIIQLSPEDIVVNLDSSVRPGEDETTDKAIEELAASIKAEGQLQAAVVQEVPFSIDENGIVSEVEYHLIAGHRRLAAIMMLNGTGKKQYKLLCSVVRGETESSSFRKSLMENLHRKSTTPIQMAMNIARIRSDNNWIGGANTAKVAKFLCVSPAQVTQHEKLLTLDLHLINLLSTGELTAQQGFRFVGVKPEKQMETLIKAMELSGVGVEDTITEAPVGQGEAEDSEVDGDEPPTKQTAKKTKKDKKSKITTEAIDQAIRETEDAGAKSISRGRKELVGWFDMFDSPAYHDNVRMFIRELVDNYATGVAKTDRKLKRLFDMMVVQISEEDLDVLPEAGAAKAKGKGKKYTPSLLSL